jgi:hypothetical protein
MSEGNPSSGKEMKKANSVESSILSVVASSERTNTPQERKTVAQNRKR